MGRGAGWKCGIKDNYLTTANIGVQGSVMSHQDNYLDLDPTCKDVYGQPLSKMTFDWQANEMAMTPYTVSKAVEIAKAMGPREIKVNLKKPGDHYDLGAFQSTHNTGGAPMGTDPAASAVNRYLQVWDVPNVFAMGASAFPHNFGYNSTGTVAALTYWAAKAIREQYLKKPRALA